MKEIIYSADIGKLQIEAQKGRVVGRVIDLDDLPQGLLNDTQIGALEQEYIKSIADLSCDNNSLQWWANPVSEKNEHLSTLYKDIYNFYALVAVIDSFTDTDLLFIKGNRLFFRQLLDYCVLKKIKCSTIDNHWWLCIEQWREDILPIFRVMRSVLTIVIRKLLIPVALRRRAERKVFLERDCYVIRTWLNSRSLILNGGQKDDYFGRLPGIISESGLTLVMVANINGSYRGALRKIQKLKEFFILPEEYFLKYSDLFRAIWIFFFSQKPRPKKVLINGLDLSALYTREINRGAQSTGYFLNIVRFFLAKNIAEKVSFKVYIQTFENYAWEKTTIMGLRMAQAKGKILGFQHAFISKCSFKYFFGKSEQAILPLPDRIITMGARTKEIMEQYGAYNEDVLRVGCALRQDYLAKTSVLQRRRFNTAVVPLTMVRNESLLILNFLCAANLPKTMKVIVRCHPQAPFDSIKKFINFHIPSNIIIDNKKDVRTQLSETDMVFYTWSTLAAEALKMGLPVVYLDILRPMRVDPLFECAALKRVVRLPGELLSAVNNLYTIDDDEFYQEQGRAQEYLKEYFYPVTKDNIKAFLS